MKKIAWLFCLFPALTFANFPIIDVEELNGTYLDEKGSAHAVKASYVLPKVEIKHQDIDVIFDKMEKQLRISDPATSVILDFDFSFLNIFKSFDFSGVDIKSTDKIFALQSDLVNLFINEASYDLEDFYIETDVRNIPTQDDEDITVIDGLILNALLRIKNLRLSDVPPKEFFQEMRGENPELIAEINELELKNKKNLKVPLIVRNASYVVKEGAFSGKALMDSWINLWLRFSGEMNTNKENSEITIRIDRAKLGIFSIRGMLLRRVRNLNLEGLSINGNTITVNLETVILGQQKEI